MSKINTSEGFQRNDQISLQDATFDDAIREVASDLVLTALHTGMSGRGFDTFAGSGCERVVVALEGLRVVGAAGYRGIQSDGDAVRIERMAVHSGYRNKGIAQEMIGYVENHAYKLGKVALELCSTRTSKGFYINRGFENPDPNQSFELRRTILDTR